MQIFLPLFKQEPFFVLFNFLQGSRINLIDSIRNFLRKFFRIAFQCVLGVFLREIVNRFFYEFMFYKNIFSSTMIEFPRYRREFSKNNSGNPTTYSFRKFSMINSSRIILVLLVLSISKNSWEIYSKILSRNYKRICFNNFALSCS